MVAFKEISGEGKFILFMTTAECRELGSCFLLRKGEITQIWNPKNKGKFKSINKVKQKVVIGVYRHANQSLIRVGHFLPK